MNSTNASGLRLPLVGKPSCRTEAPAFNPLTPCLDSTNSQRGICDLVFLTGEANVRGVAVGCLWWWGGTRKSRPNAFRFKVHENCGKPSVENATSFHPMRLPSRGASPAADGLPVRTGQSPALRQTSCEQRPVSPHPSLSASDRLSRSDNSERDERNTSKSSR